MKIAFACLALLLVMPACQTTEQWIAERCRSYETGSQAHRNCAVQSRHYLWRFHRPQRNGGP